LAARLPVYEETLRDGELGLLFAPGDVQTLAAQLARLLGDAGLRKRLQKAAASVRQQLGWDRVADDYEAVYEEVAGRRHPLDGQPDLRKRLRVRKLIDVDLHMHTDHSP